MGLIIRGAIARGPHHFPYDLLIEKLLKNMAIFRQIGWTIFTVINRDIELKPGKKTVIYKYLDVPGS